MRAAAVQKLTVYDAYGNAKSGAYIAPGDVCAIDAPVGGLYPVTYPVSGGTRTLFLKNLSGFLYNQNVYGAYPYPAPGYASATIKSGGCGVCCASMAIETLTGKAFPPPKAAEYARRVGARVSGGTNMSVLTNRLAADYGLSVSKSDALPDLLAHLQRGGLAICNVGGNGMFSTGGHYMVVFGQLGGQLCIGDPGLYSGKYRSARRKSSVTVSGDLIFALPTVLHADCQGRSPRYYLLRKK